MKKIVIHWLYPKMLTLVEAQNSHLASLRLRAAIAAETFLRQGFSVSFGELIPPGTNVLFVPKIGADNIDSRAPIWLDLMRQARSRGAKIVIDYTDHHLGFASPMRAFYSEAMTQSDAVIAPSSTMQKSLLSEANVQSSLIRDAIEYSIQAPRRRLNKKSRLIWFGHGSNLRFLLSFFQTRDLQTHFDDLSIVTSIEGINWISQHSKELALPRTRLIPWSRESLLRAALSSDLAFLPVGVNDPGKSGASSNRLITAFALGLPVVTQSLPAYKDYRDFYTDLDEDQYTNIIASPWCDNVRVLNAQRTVVPRYTPEQISHEWLDYLLKILN